MSSLDSPSVKARVGRPRKYSPSQAHQARLASQKKYREKRRTRILRVLRRHDTPPIVINDVQHSDAQGPPFDFDVAPHPHEHGETDQVSETYSVDEHSDSTHSAAVSSDQWSAYSSDGSSVLTSFDFPTDSPTPPFTSTHSRTAGTSVKSITESELDCPSSSDSKVGNMSNETFVSRVRDERNKLARLWKFLPPHAFGMSIYMELARYKYQELMEDVENGKRQAEVLKAKVGEAEDLNLAMSDTLDEAYCRFHGGGGRYEADVLFVKYSQDALELLISVLREAIISLEGPQGAFFYMEKCRKGCVRWNIF